MHCRDIKTLLRILSPSALFINLLLLACAESDDASPEDNTENENLNGTDSDKTGNQCEEVTSSIVFDEAHNYTFKSHVEIKAYPLQQYPNVPKFDWSGLTRNLLGHEIDPSADIGHIEIIMWNLDEYKIFEDWLSRDSLDMEKFSGVVLLNDLDKKRTWAKLDEFTSFGQEIEAEKQFKTDGMFPSDSHIYVLVLGSGTALGYGAQIAAFIEPVDSPDAPTDLEITSDAADLTYNVKLSSKSYHVPADAADVMINWIDGMEEKKNALGEPWQMNQVHQVMLVFLEGMDAVDLEENFLDLEQLADKTYTYEAVTAKPVTLGEFKDENGDPFEAFDRTDGLWIIALRCTQSCNNPAPKYLSILKPCLDNSR